MHHLFAFAGSVAQDAVLAYVPTLVDEILTPFSSTVYTIGTPLKLLRYYARGNAVSKVQFDSPILRLVGPPQVQPFDTAADPPSLPPINKRDLMAMTLQPNDPLGMQVSRAGAGAAVCQVLIWASGAMPATPVGAARRVLGTSAITLTTSSWVSGALTFSQSLPTGRYDIVGMSAQGANLLGARLIFSGQTWRPGVLAQQAAGEYDHEWFSAGNFGTFGSFDSWAPPTVQCLGYGAGASQSIYLDLVPRNVPGLVSDPSR